jgi:hypothetical protein
LERRGGPGYRRDEEDRVWRDAGDTSKFVATETYYYVPLSGFTMLSAKGYQSGKELYEDVKSLPGLFNGEIYGVRKTDIEDIKKKPNWKNFEDHIVEKLAAKDNSKLLMRLVKGSLERADILGFVDNRMVLDEIDANSPYAKLISVFVKVDKFTGNRYNIDRLFRKFAPNANLSPDALVSKYQKEIDSVDSRYPLLRNLNTYRVKASDIAEYINMCDAKRGV